MFILDFSAQGATDRTVSSALKTTCFN